MKDTDIITLNMPITVLQARYLRRKLKDWAKTKKSQCRKDAYYVERSQHFGELVMIEGLISQVDQLIDTDS
jgi:hypothetical protein